MRRIKLVLAMATVLVGMLALQAGPALADDDGCIGPRGDNGNCIGVETERGHHDFGHHDHFAETVDCEFVGFDGNEAIYVCEIDF